MWSYSRFALGVWFLAIAGIPALLRAEQPAPPSLGAVASFAVLGGSAVTSSGSTIVTGNLGVSPGNTVTGFPPGTVKVGATFRNDSTARQAQRDATAAYDDLAGRTGGIDLSGQDLGGKTLVPGVYCFSSSAQLTGTLILDAANDSNAVWIFQIGGTLTTSLDSSVLVINAGHESNIFWQVGNTATLGARTAFLGNILAVTSITLNNGASLSGRLLAGGTVALDSNNVSLCCASITLAPPTAALPTGTVGAAYGPTTITASGGVGVYSFAALLGSLPLGMILSQRGVLSGTPTAAGSYSVTVNATDSTQVCSGSRIYKINILCPAITLSPSAVPATPNVPFILPPATVGVPYTQTFSPSCIAQPYVCAVSSGAPPPGLSLANCTLSGTPTTPGTFIFTITATDTLDPAASQKYEIGVFCPSITLSPSTAPATPAVPFALPPATVSVPYTQTFSPSCAAPPYSCAVTVGLPPPGLIFANCTLSGTPPTPGTFIFTLMVTDLLGSKASQIYTIVVTCPISPATLPPGIVCMPYGQPITPSCGTPPYTCSVSSGGLPPGLTLANCLISGTPTVAGTFSFTVTATDAASSSTAQPYTIVITCPPIPVDPPVLPPASTCQPYLQPLARSCGTGPYVFSVTQGVLPNGLSLSPAGVLSGTPSTAGSYPFTVTAVDPVSGCPASTAYTLVVTCVTITPATLPGPVVGIPYNETITASGGTAPYTFSISGTLPPGLTFMQTTPTTATISGTPTTNGVFNFCITVTDANLRCTVTQCYAMLLAAGGAALSVWGMVVLCALLVSTGCVVIRKGG